MKTQETAVTGEGNAPRFIVFNSRVGLYEADRPYSERTFTNLETNARIYYCEKDASEVARCLNSHGSGWKATIANAERGQQ